MGWPIRFSTASFKAPRAISAFIKCIDFARVLSGDRASPHFRRGRELVTAWLPRRGDEDEPLDLLDPRKMFVGAGDSVRDLLLHDVVRCERFHVTVDSVV